MRRQLRRLKSENRRLRRENEYLRHRTVQLGDGGAIRDGREAQVMRETARSLSVSRSRTYFGYLMLSLKSSRVFRFYDKTSFAVRNFFFASKLWGIITGIAAVLGISAQVLLPAAFILSAVVAAVGFFAHRKWNRAFENILAGQRLYVLFAPKGRHGSGYFSAMAHGFAEHGVVLVVSRSLSFCGFSGARAVGGNLYRIHTSYYFSLAKRFGLSGAKRIVKIT